MLAVCDNMKIVDVPEEGRRCFIFQEQSPERKRENKSEVERDEEVKKKKCKLNRPSLEKHSRKSG